MPADGFSVRWTKTQYFGAGRYKFTAVADDGCPALHRRQAGDRSVAGPGEHRVQLHRPSSAKASTRSRWTTSSTAADATGVARLGQRARPADRTPTGRSTGTCRRASTRSRHRARSSCATRTRSTTTGARARPAPGIGANRFAARWTRTMSFAPGDYEFAVTADDGVRLYVDGVRVIDKWIDQGADHVPHDAAAGRRSAQDRHGVLRERWRGGGPAELHASRRSTRPMTAYHAEYWNTPDADRIAQHPDRPGGPRARRRDARLRLGRRLTGRRASRADRFVARWTKTVALSAGLYRFCGVRDDGHAGIHRQRAGGRQLDLRQRRLQRRQGRARRHARAARGVLRGRRRRARRVHLRPRSATSCPRTAGTPPSTSPTATCRARPS